MTEPYWDGDVYVAPSGQRISLEEVQEAWKFQFKHSNPPRDPHYKPIEPDSRNVDPFLRRRMWK